MEEVGMTNIEKELNALMDALIFVENKSVRKIMVDSFEKKHGSIPGEYKDAVDALIDL